MSTICRNYLTVSGSTKDLQRFINECKGFRPYYPPKKDEAFLSKYESELMKIRKEKYHTYKDDPDRHGKSYAEAVNDIKIKYGYDKYTDEIWVQHIEDEKQTLLSKPSQFCLNALFPVPQDIIDICDGISWCRENWGTKDDIICAELGNVIFEENISRYESESDTTEEDESLIFIRFETSSAPPIPWVLKVSGDFSCLNFNLCYEVATNDIEHGVFIACGGKVLHS